MKIKEKRGVVWYIEFMVAVVIFIVTLSIYFEYRNNIIHEESNQINELLIDAKLISNSLMSQGEPHNWTTENVQRIGLTNNNYRLNISKLNNFTSLDPSDARQIFKTKYKYYVRLEDQNGKTIPINGLNGTGFNPENEGQRITVTRMLIYNQNLTKMILDLWI